ncbi:MAG: hypothetical protein M1840_006813 [Geoglossum simile]|nr:MAG: hypothetical protein M1840_006813 [Geoglossum simile]
MDPSQTLSHLRRKLQAADGRQTSPRLIPGLTVLPPPAYTPATTAPPSTQQQPGGTAQPDPYADDDSDEDGCSYRPIAIRIDAPLKVVGHANVVSADTQTMTARLASTVVATIQGSLAAAAARPLQVTVACGVTVVGSRNVIGDGVTRALMARAAALKMEMERSAAVRSTKRRAESEPPQLHYAKRRDDRDAPAAKAPR